MDSSREIRSMILVAFPCPPLPMEGSGRFVNSHDMLAYLIDVAARREDKADNAKREKNQEVLMVQYEKDMKLCRSETETWNAMTMFTRQYMMTYSVIMHEARFLPFDAITPPLKKQLCSWLAAQHILQGDDHVCGSMFEHLDAWPLYLRCINVINNQAAICLSREQCDEVGHGANHCDVLPESAGADLRCGRPVCESVPSQ